MNDNQQQQGNMNHGETQPPPEPPSQLQAHYENNQQQPGRGVSPSQLETHYENNQQQPRNTDRREAQPPPQPPSQLEAHYENNQQQPGRGDSGHPQEPRQQPPPPQAQQHRQLPQQSPLQQQPLQPPLQLSQPPQSQPPAPPAAPASSPPPQVQPQPKTQTQTAYTQTENNPVQAENEDSRQPERQLKSPPPKAQQQLRTQLTQLQIQLENNAVQAENEDSRQLQMQPQNQIRLHKDACSQTDVTQSHYKDRDDQSLVMEMAQKFKNQVWPESMDLNELMNLEEDARMKCNEPPKELTEALKDITRIIIDKLNETYEFKGNIFQIGSSVDGTKIGMPDEFDYLYVVNRDLVEHRGHDGHELFCGNKELKASEIAEDFMNKMDKIAAKLDLTNSCLEHGGFASPSYSGCRRNGPAATLLFYSKAGEDILISLDFTIAFPLATDEETKIRLEIARKAGPLLPRQDKTAEFLKDTLCLVAVEPDKDRWKVSTARLEATLLSRLPKDHCLKIAMRYGKILSKKQISDIPDTSNIFYDLRPENVVTENLAEYKDNKKNMDEEIHLLENLQKGMRLAHYYLTPSKGQEYRELTSSMVKLDSASIKHLALKIVCKDNPKLAKDKGKESAKIIIEKILDKLANQNMCTVDNYLIDEHRIKIKMVCIAMYVGKMWQALTDYAKKRCEQFLKDNRLATETALHQSSQGITDEVADAYIAGRDSNTSDTVLSQTTTSLDKRQYSGTDPRERMKLLVTATKQSRMDKPQRDTELADYVVPLNERDCPEHTFLVRFTKDELIAKDYPVIGKITNALLNAIGGILILESTDGELNKKELAAWQRSCTDYMERFMPEQIVTSIHFKPLPSGMIMFIPKSQNLMLYNACIITRSPSGNEHNSSYDSLVDIMSMKSNPHHYVQMKPEYYFDDGFPHREEQNREYKHWKVTSFEDIINHISSCPHFRHQRAPKHVCDITPGSNTEHQEAARRFRQTLLAMANEPCGGEVIIGIAKIQRMFLIKGLHLEDADRGDFEDLINDVLKNDPVTGEPRVWREPGRFPQKEQHWRVTYHDVNQTPKNDRRVITRIQIDHYPGGVFEAEPVAYDVDQDGYATQMKQPFAEWKEGLTIPTIPVMKNTKTPDSVDPETMDAVLMNRKERLDESPKAEINKETPDSVEADDPETMNAALMNRKELSWTKDKLKWDEGLEESEDQVENDFTNDPYFALNNPLNFNPPKETVLRRHPLSDVKIKEIEKYHQSDRGFVICVRSWMSHLMEKTIPKGHVTDLLVFVQKEGIINKGSNFHELHLWVICGTAGDQQDDWRYAIQTSLSLKQQLIKGGCLAISVICHTLRGDYRICSSTSGHQEEIMEYLCCKSEKTVELVKKTLSEILFQEDLYFTNRVGNRALINLTEEQAKTLFMSVSSQTTFIRGPPGSGKTILAMCIAKRYDPKKVRFVCTTESFLKYILFSVQCESYLVKSGGVNELKKWIQSVIESIECLIFDDVHNLECTKEDWYTILEQLMQSGKNIHLFADPDIQAYKETNSTIALKDAILHIEEKYGIEVYQQQLTGVHRNTRKVTAFIKDAVSSSTSPGGIQIKAANSLNGDDIETLYKGGLRLEGADNDLVVLIQELTLVYPPHDIAVLLGGEKAVEDKIFYTQVLSEHLDCKVHGADHHPPEGVQVDVVDEYLGLDAPVVIHLNSKPTPMTQMDNPKYRSFIASRGIFRVIFLVEEPLNHHHYKQMKLDRPLKLDAASTQHGKSLDAASTQHGESSKMAAGDLIAAAKAGDVNRVSVLLEQGADINAVDGLHDTALGWAVWSGELEVVKLLLSLGAGIERGKKPLSHAAAYGRIDTVQCLLQHGADINGVDGYGYTALGLAAEHGELEVVKLLLSLGADTEGGEKKPLSLAAHEGHIDIIQCLLQHGASQEAKNQALTAALNPPSWFGDRTKANLKLMVEILRSHGAVADGEQ